MIEQFSIIMDKLHENYEVKDIITNNSCFFFILESPHIKELKYGVPVAGSSGISMSKHLLGNDYHQPLGRLVKDHIEQKKQNDWISNIGLLNVCTIPMQKKAYQDESLIEEYHLFFELLEGVRKNNQTDVYRNEQMNEMQEVILQRFRERLNHLKNKSCVMVPCGKFAQKFFRLAAVDSKKWTVINHVPHPSYQAWSRKRYETVITHVIQTFQNGCENQ